jgi:enoyl-CoA hydratase/carnithine racemase
MRVALLGSYERMSAQRAHEIGLVTEVVPLDGLHDAAAWVANAIASSPPIAVQGTVRSLWAARELSRMQALDMGKVIIRLGSDPGSLYAGQQAFASGKRIEPKVR